MKYFYKILLFLLLIPLNLYPGENEDQYKRSLELWNRAGIKEYYIKIHFTAFSPLTGIWELNVKDGKVYLCRFNGELSEDYRGAEMFTIENLYKIAGESIAAGKKNPFKIKAVYSKKNFFHSLSKTRNTEYKGKIKTDTSFKIEVNEFIPGAGKL